MVGSGWLVEGGGPGNSICVGGVAVEEVWVWVSRSGGGVTAPVGLGGGRGLCCVGSVVGGVDGGTALAVVFFSIWILMSR